MNPYHVRTGQNSGCDGCQRGIAPASDWRIYPLIERRQGSAQKSFARGACQERLAQAAQFLKAREQRVILLLDDAKTEARVEDNPLPLDSRFQGLLQPLS